MKSRRALLIDKHDSRAKCSGIVQVLVLTVAFLFTAFSAALADDGSMSTPAVDAFGSAEDTAPIRDSALQSLLKPHTISGTTISEPDVTNNDITNTNLSPSEGKAATQFSLSQLPLIASESKLASENRTEQESKLVSENKADQDFSLAPLTLPDEPAQDHDRNKVMRMKTFQLHTSVQNMPMFQALKLESAFDRPITLKETLQYAARNNLSIKISEQSMHYQRDVLISNIGTALPSLNTSYAITKYHILPDTNATGVVFQSGIQLPVFQGGFTAYSILAQYYRERGWREAYHATINDNLLDVYNKYSTLLLNRVLLSIRAKSLEVSKAELDLNEIRFKTGVGTQFEVMQSRTQLARDRQAYLQQQVAVRIASLNLSYALNCPMAINLVPQEDDIAELALFDEKKLDINKLLEIAMEYRPDLRQYEWYRLAANRNLQAASGALYPNAGFFLLYTHSDVTVSPAENNDALKGAASASVASALNSQFTGRASNNALAQTASFTPGSSSTGTSGANTGAATTVAASGGTPINVVQSGSLVTSGAVAPSIVFPSGSLTGSNVNGSFTAGAGSFAGRFNTFQAGFGLSWSLPNFGTTVAANLMSLKHFARQALLQANQQLQSVVQSVRSDSLDAVAARMQIDRAAYAVESSAEALRQADLRQKNGIGTNLEFIQAERDYVTALTAQAQAIIASNQSQAKVLRDIGVISVDTLTRGFDPAVDLPTHNSKPGKLKAKRTKQP